MIVHNQPLKFVSICIPSFNRPNELKRLLESVDYVYPEELEIVICEDKSPKRTEIREIVGKYKEKSNFEVSYTENKHNLGYDANLRELIKKAKGEYVIFMGDDDEFIPNALTEYIKFLKENCDLGYILKTSRTIHNDNSIEEFRYYPKSIYFDASYEAYITLFRKSVFISGFTFRRVYSLPFLVDNFDGTLLFQLYLLAEITLKHRSAYCDILLTQQYEGGIPYFGSSDVEKNHYTPGTVTIQNSINFMSSFFKITQYMDDKYLFQSTKLVKLDISKYSYPVLSIQRSKGYIDFIKYFMELNKLGLNNTVYYFIYFFGLLILGKKNCDKVIRLIKKILGRTPRL
jgi:abequosyltransferase